MRRILGLEELGAPLKRTALTIGKFFAIHRGHQALLQATVAAARREQALSGVLTFDRHPAEILRPGTELPLLASRDERLDLIEAQGLDFAVVAHVTPEFLNQEPEQFVRDILVGQLGVVEVLAGENFRFGQGARGNLDTLRALDQELGFQVTPVPPVMAGGHRISSSRVAECIAAGRVAAAAELLARYYAVPGTVIRGEQLGRRLGFPTANVRTEPRRLLPADGIYVVRMGWKGSATPQPGVASLGVRPTLGGRPRLLEVHLLDWDGDLYGHEVRIEFLERLRDEEQFPDLEALQAQIGRDVEAARRFFRSGGVME
jgi:riboflavin kinase / FMN adenylyltransferase